MTILAKATSRSLSLGVNKPLLDSEHPHANLTGVSNFSYQLCEKKTTLSCSVLKSRVPFQASGLSLRCFPVEVLRDDCGFY